MLVGHKDRVRAAAVTMDGSHVISVSDDKTIRVWDLQSGGKERIIRGHKHLMSAVVVTADGRFAVTASSDRTLRVWDVSTPPQGGSRDSEKKRILIGHEAFVNAVALTADGRRVVSASSDRTVRVWNLENGEELALIVLDGAVESVSVAPNGTTIVAGDAGGNVYCLKYVESRGKER